jgi:hypothetical protein
MPGEMNEGATRVPDQRAGGPYALHSPSVAFVHTMPIGALTIGGEEMTCSLSTRSM